MAVIRAKRLWWGSVPSGTLAGVMPAGEGEPETRATQVYTVPLGKRAILRTATFTLENIPAAGTSPTMAAWMRPFNTGGFQVAFFWHWFFESTSGIIQYRLHAQWDGILVLHAGDQIAINHGATGIYLNTTGSGHELNELT